MKILVPFAEGFEEIEALTIVDVLRRAGIEVVIVGVPSSIVTGSQGVRIFADKKISEIDPEDYDGIVLPGGNPGYKNLAKSEKILEMIRKFNSEGKLVAAICGSPAVLAKAGILQDKKATIYPGMEKEIPYPRSEKVVVDENVITSQAPGTAMEFALKIVEYLLGKDRALSLRKGLVC
jgi:4-methyl-5(b-hydroxyethyl)-thiazole monophosphate biosynthesis